MAATLNVMIQIILSALVVLLIPLQAFASFLDVSANSWYSQYVSDAFDLGIVSGYKDSAGNPTGMFKPENDVTLAEALKIALEAAGYDYNDYPTQPWDSGHWVMPYYRIALQEGFGIFVGATENVDKSATRLEVASIIIDAFFPGQRVEIMERDYENPYRDVTIQTTTQSGKTGWGWNGFILKLTEDGIFNGDKNANGNPTGYFRPNDPINRAEVVKTVMEARRIYGVTGTNRKQTHHVTYSDRGFLETPMTIKVGGEITFYNNNGYINMWIASDPHPEHDGYPEFDAKAGVGVNEVWSFRFMKSGTWAYHNHLKPEHSGVIVVEE